MSADEMPATLFSEFSQGSADEKPETLFSEISEESISCKDDPREIKLPTTLPPPPPLLFPQRTTFFNIAEPDTTGERVLSSPSSSEI